MTTWLDDLHEEQGDGEMASYELRSMDFASAQADAQMAYIEAERENKALRELFEDMYGYYVSGTLTPCDFCAKYECEGDAPVTCKVDECDPDGDELVRAEIERRARELGMEVD